MIQQIQYRVMQKPNYKQITACIGDNPKQVRWRDYPVWGTELLQFHAPDHRLYLGAYNADELVGCMIAHPDLIQIRDNSYRAAIIAITEVRMMYRQQGIASTLLAKMLNRLEALNYEVVLAFQTAGRGGKGMLKRAGFQKIHKYGHAGKALDKTRMAQLMDLNPILKKIALKIVDASIGETEPPRGIIRKARDTDLEEVVALLNQETNRLDISSIWTIEKLTKMLEWRYQLFVFENKGVILGAIIAYEEIATLGRDYFISGLLRDMVFREDVELEERVILLNYALAYFRQKGIPSVSYPYPKNVLKILKKAGFNILPGDERSGFIKFLSNKDLNCASIQICKYVNIFLIC
ncbi:MAG: GNAT family N-acetyltransferase [Candidatus Helarchaeota archaeon]